MENQYTIEDTTKKKIQQFLNTIDISNKVLKYEKTSENYYKNKKIYLK